MRFGGTDGIFTSSTANQRDIIPPTEQVYPGDAGVQPAAVDGTYTGSVNRTVVEPVTGGVSRASLELVAGTVAATEPVSATVPFKKAAPDVDTMSTGTVAPVAKAVVEQPMPANVEEDTKGWSRAGGTQVTVKDGETVYNLSRRFGVPPKDIMKANGLSSASALKAGQKIVIPTYVYSRTAPNSMPDSDPNVAEAKSSKGTKFEVPTEKVPVPTKPGDKLAVLPNSPKLKEPDASSASSETSGKKTAAAGTYKVAPGDTLSRIAQKTGVKVPALKEANGLKDGLIRVGQLLKIPGGIATQTVAAADKTGVDPIVTGSSGPAKKASSEEVAGYTPPKKKGEVSMTEAESDMASAPDATGIGRMRWPVRGRVISNYGSGGGTKANDGIDIAVPEGTTVKAAENGVVIYAGDGLKDFGNTVLVRHEDGLVTVYGHASAIEVKRGDKVKRGQEIAKSGMSGSADSPKLHFEVRKDSAPVDPSGYLE